MTTPFDPYHRWLAIPAEQRPPTYFQLLGVAPTETDPAVIEEAALRQASHVRTYQTGPHAALCTSLLNEIGQARATLLNPAKRREYEARLKPAAPPPPPLPVPAAPSPAPAVPAPFSRLGEEESRSFLRRRREVRGVVPFWSAAGWWLYVLLLGAAGFVGYRAAQMTLPPGETAPRPGAEEPRPARKATREPGEGRPAPAGRRA